MTFFPMDNFMLRCREFAAQVQSKCCPLERRFEI
ncbi:unnamed protein product [Haemonchus placei]|uniref:Uncharacterized protein n=1 Tax=Haemonchus placei TaxID=6290 RepID=A0A0N4W8I4_HAEPC|nr:unnamed protein product [Haemonchus placei]